MGLCKQVASGSWSTQGLEKQSRRPDSRAALLAQVPVIEWAASHSRSLTPCGGTENLSVPEGFFFFFPQILARPWTREHHSSEECYKILLSSVCHLILISALILAWQYCMSLSDQGTQWPREHTHYFSQFPYTFPKGLDIMLWANSTSNNKGKYFMLRASLGRRTGSALYSETSDVTVFCHGSKLITKWQFFSAKNISRVTLIEISRVQIPT